MEKIGLVIFMLRSISIRSALVITLVACLEPTLVFASADVKSDLYEIKAHRDVYASKLLAPIQKCVQRHDTQHVLFHGCIDWHSSVHGLWALTAASRLLESDEIARAVKVELTPENIEAERSYLRLHSGFEMPYGRAWFLRLAIEFDKAFDDTRLVAFADEVADSLVTHFDDYPIRPLSDSYYSASWALINLRAYGNVYGRDDLVDFVDRIVRKHFLSNLTCPLDSDERNRSFMAGCTNWAWLVSEVLGEEEFITWVNRFIPDPDLLKVIRNPVNSHMHGLDFSRAWGLWRIYRKTNDERWLRLYIEHLEYGLQNSSWWTGDYQRVSHWVAQFGMFAIIPLYEPDYK